MAWVVSPEEIEKRTTKLQAELAEAENKVASIRSRLSRLDSLKRELTEEFGDGSQLPMEFPPLPPLPTPSHILSGRKPTSTERIIHYLVEHGPAKRTLISQETGIPMGTLHFAMSDHTTFRSTFRNRWDVAPAVREAYREKVLNGPKPLISPLAPASAALKPTDNAGSISQQIRTTLEADPDGEYQAEDFERYAKEKNIAMASIRTALARMADHDIITRTRRGYYQAKPKG